MRAYRAKVQIRTRYAAEYAAAVDTQGLCFNVKLHKAVNTAKGDLCRHRDRNPTGGA